MRILQPPGWPRPRGYANGVAAEGRLVFVAGQIGWDATGTIVSDDLVDQLRQTLENTLAVLREAGAGPQHVARMTWYVTDKREYLARARELGEAYRALMGTPLSGDGGGRGQGADRGPRQGRDRDHRGRAEVTAPAIARSTPRLNFAGLMHSSEPTTRELLGS